MSKIILSAFVGALMVGGAGSAFAETPCSCLISSGSGQTVGLLASSNGSVFVKSSKGYVAPQPNAVLKNGSQIAIGEGGSATLNFAGGCTVSAKPNTMVTISSMGEGQSCVRSAEFSVGQESTFGQVGVGVGAGVGAGAGTGLGVGLGAAAVVGGIGVGFGAINDDDSLNGTPLPAGTEPDFGPGSLPVSN